MSHMQQNEKIIEDDLAESFYEEIESLLEEANQEIQDIKPDKEIENKKLGNQPDMSGTEGENGIQELVYDGYPVRYCKLYKERYGKDVENAILLDLHRKWCKEKYGKELEEYQVLQSLYFMRDLEDEYNDDEYDNDDDDEYEDEDEYEYEDDAQELVYDGHPLRYCKLYREIYGKDVEDAILLDLHRKWLKEKYGKDLEEYQIEQSLSFMRDLEEEYDEDEYDDDEDEDEDDDDEYEDEDDEDDDYSNKESSEEGGCLKSFLKNVFLLVIVGFIINSFFSNNDKDEEKAKPTPNTNHVNQTNNDDAYARDKAPSTQKKPQDTHKKDQTASKTQDIEFMDGGYWVVDHIGSKRGRFCVFEMTIANISNEPVSVNRSGFTLYDTKGRKYSCSDRGMTELFYNNEPSYHLVSLQPGETFTGKIVFEVKEDFEFAKLSVEPHMFKKGFVIVPHSK